MDKATDIVGGASQMVDMAQGVMGDDPTKKGQIALGAGGGALKGAMALSALGPIGMAAGALGGGIMAAIKAKRAKQEALDAEQEAEQDAYQQSLKPTSFATTDTGVAKTGQRRLPGGLEVELRNGAKKFVGNKHDEAGNGSDSGIILEHSTKSKKGLEVEDGELEVKDSRGGTFIVSHYLKDPDTGKPLAEGLEKELKGLDKTKDAKKIQQINDKYIKKNEELKDDKKEPDEVKAAHGMRRAHMQGGGRMLKTYEEFVTAYPKFDDPKAAYNSYIESMVGNDDQGAGAQRARTEMGEVNKINAKQGHSDMTRSTTGNLQAVNALPEAEVAAAYPNPNTSEDPSELERDAPTDAPETMKTPTLSNQGVTKALKTDSDKKVEEMRKMERPDREERKDFRQANKEEKEKVPFGRFYGQGTGLQALGALAYLTKKDDPEAPVIAPGYLNRIPPARYKSFAPERAASEKAYTSQVNAIDTSIAGPAAIAARQAAASSQAANMSNIATAETRDRASINNMNAQNELRVAMANQQAFNNAQRANATAKYMADRERFQNKYAALDKIGDVGAQAIKDRNTAVAEDLTAEATQIGGAYTRAKEAYDPMFGIGRFSRKNRQAFQNRQTGLTPEEAKSLALLNDQTTQEEEDARRGKRRYTKKPGKIRRRRTKKK
jgi:hypothetical protein